MDLADKLKTALDESRLLILGAQVVFGCQFQMVFQERFQDAPRDSQTVQGIGLLALMLAVGLLITPSMTHQIAYRGEDRRGALRVASTCGGLAMVPMTLGLGATTFVVFESLFNRNIGIGAGITFAAVAFSFLYALGLVLRIGHKGQMPLSEKQTLLKNKIEQLLTEARVIIPGRSGPSRLPVRRGLRAIRSRELPGWVKMTHAAALASVASLSVVLLMTPAALHRIAYDGENSPSFFRISSALVVAAAFPLAVGIAADICVVGFNITGGARLASLSGCVSLLILETFWFFHPLWLRHARGALLTMGELKAPIGPNTAHLCIDMQRLFSDEGPWPMAWMPRVTPKSSSWSSVHRSGQFSRALTLRRTGRMRREGGALITRSGLR